MLRCHVLLACALSSRATVFLQEDFSGDWQSRWVVSNWKRKEKQQGKWNVTVGAHYVDAEKNKGLRTTQDGKFYAISTRFDPISTTGKPLIIQYLVKNEQNWKCAGAYLKLFPSTVDQTTLSNADPYAIMFGPDVCEPHRKTHVIFQYKGKSREMKEALRPDVDPMSHLYTLIIRANQTYEIQFDLIKVREGSLFEDFDFLPPAKIKDPSASKPPDWIDDRTLLIGREKPEWWDDVPRRIPEPDAVKPVDWNDETDGLWVPPYMENPDYRGAWRPERVPNPDYIGKWEHPLIDNPDFKNDSSIGFYPDLSVLAFELWQVKAGTLFDAILVSVNSETNKIRLGQN